jgi:hypothetical protein
MLSSLCAAVLCAAIPVGSALEVPARAAEGDPSVELGVHLTSTTFRARNFSDVEQLMVFSNGAGEPVFVVLPVGAYVEYDFQPEDLDGVRMEVVSLREGAWKASGAQLLTVNAATGEETMWFQPGERRVHTWQQDGCEVSERDPSGTLLPDGFIDQGTQSDLLLAPTHVPVITPWGGNGGDLPPRIDPNPLPDV